MTGTALVTYSEKRAAAAQSYVAQTRAPPAGDLLKIKAGRFMFGDDDLGDQLPIVALNSVYVNTYYGAEYVEGQAASPTCYAYGQAGEEMAPHPSMAEHPQHFIPQNDTCNGCALNEFGSAPKGAGKACQNRVRLAIFPAGQYTPRPKSKDSDLDLYDGTTDEGKAHFRDADALSIVLPVTSVKNWDSYVAKLAALGQPPFGVATRIYTQPHAKFQFEVLFEMLDVLPDEVYDILAQRHEAMGDIMATPYSPPRSDEEKERRGGVKGLVRR